MVLVIESESTLRRHVVKELEVIGTTVTSISRVSELERWPHGEIVITDFKHFTPFWLTAGATHIIVLTDCAAEGADACRRGALTWVPHASAATLIATLGELGSRRGIATGAAPAQLALTAGAENQ